METIWFMIVAVMLAAYVVMDGFDIGAGIIYLAAARTDEERRMILRAIGPVTPMDGIQTSSPATGTTPALVRKPNTLFQPAGLRRLPP